MSEVIFVMQIDNNYTTCAFTKSSLLDPRRKDTLLKDPMSLFITNEMPTVAVFDSSMNLQSFGYEAKFQIEIQNTETLLVFSDFIREIFCHGTKVGI